MNEIALWAWAAGIIDGEGCFQIHLNSGVSVRVGMTHEGTCRKLKQIFCCGSTGGPYQRDKSRQPYFTYEAHGEDAITVTRKLQPYLFTKSEQAKIVIEFGETCMFKRGTFGIGTGRGKVPIEVQALREVLREELSDLNQAKGGSKK